MIDRAIAWTRCFASGNTLRITLSRGARKALDALRGDLLEIRMGQDEHQVILINLSARSRSVKKIKRK